MSISTLLRENTLDLFCNSITQETPTPIPITQIAFSGVNPDDDQQLVIKGLSLGTNSGDNTLILNADGFAFGAFDPSLPDTPGFYNGSKIISDDNGIAIATSTNDRDIVLSAAGANAEITINPSGSGILNIVGLPQSVYSTAVNNLCVTSGGVASIKNVALGFLVKKTGAQVINTVTQALVIGYTSVPTTGYNIGTLLNSVSGIITIPAACTGIYLINAELGLDGTDAEPVILQFYSLTAGSPTTLIAASNYVFNTTARQTVSLTTAVQLIAGSTYGFVINNVGANSVTVQEDAASQTSTISVQRIL